jgi:hypothetical protein
MPRHTIDLSVLPNPYHALDHEGRPAGPCPRERTPTTVGHQGYVGAERHCTVPEKLVDGHQGTPAQDTCWQFSKEPTQVRDPHGYYRQMLRDGALFPADAKTARMAGPDVKYAPYAELLADAKKLANGRWRAAFAEDAPGIDLDPFAKPTPGLYPGDAPAAASDPTPMAVLVNKSEPSKKEAK